MTTISIKKADLITAIQDNHIGGQKVLTINGDIFWKQDNAMFQSWDTDTPYVSIPNIDPDGSGALYDAAQSEFKEIFFDLSKEEIDEKIEDYGSGAWGFLQDNYPENAAAIIEYLTNSCIDNLKEALESVVVDTDESGDPVTEAFFLEIVD